MALKLSALRAVLPRIVADLGCEIHPRGDAGVLLADRDALSVTLRMPYAITETVEIDSEKMRGDGATMIDVIDAGRARLFAKVAAHMCEHGDDPHRRLTAIEAMARTLIEAVESRVDLREQAELRRALDDAKDLLRRAA